MTNQFQVGQTYTIINRGYELGQVTVTKRTDKSVWLKHEDGTESRKGIKILNDYEVVQSKDFNLYSNRPSAALETTETTSEPTKVTVTESKVKSLIVCDREAISDVVYSELIEAFNLKDDERLPAWGGFYRYEKPKKSLTMPGVYFVHYEHVNGRSGGNYQVKVTFDEPCKTVETPQDTTTESQDNQNELVKTYAVSTAEGLETDDQPEYNAYIVTAPNPSTALETIKTRLMSQKTRFKILGVCEAPATIENDEWLEF